jgi:hypothetical protein
METKYAAKETGHNKDPDLKTAATTLLRKQREKIHNLGSIDVINSKEIRLVATTSSLTIPK